MWLGKFQAFTKSKDLESVNDEDYKAFLTFLAVKKMWPVRFRIRRSTPCSFLEYHIHERHVQCTIKAAVKKAMLTKRVTAHAFRHSFATHLLQAP